MLDFSKMKRDRALGEQTFQKTKGGQIVAKAACQIVVPSRYFEVGLGTIGEFVECLGVFGLVVDGVYTASIALAIMPFSPDSVTKCIIDDAEYTILNFGKGSTICPNYNLVKSDTLLYYIDEWFYKGAHIPHFFTEEDAGKLMRDLEYYTGVKVTRNNRPWELITSFITRSNKDIRQFYRFVGERKLVSPIYVPLDSVAFSAVGTFSKLSGAYMDEGLLSAALQKSNEISKIEEVVRS